MGYSTVLDNQREHYSSPNTLSYTNHTVVGCSHNNYLDKVGWLTLFFSGPGLNDDSVLHNIFQIHGSFSFTI